MKKYRIRPMQESDIARICEIHQSVLPTVTARISKSLLSRMYQKILQKPELHISIVVVSGKNIVGAITATRDLARTQEQISNLLFFLPEVRNICTALLSRKISLSELIDRALTEGQISSNFPGRYSTILTFFVDTSSQHQGLGTKLLKEVFRQLPGKSKLFVDTELKNTKARDWYKSHGFREIMVIRKTIIFNRLVSGR